MNMPALFDLTGRVAVVTGGNGGIGRSIALGFAEAGAAVAVFGRNDEKNQQVLAELKSIGVPSLAMKVDMTDRAGLQPAVNRVESELGSVSILVNNAGNVSLSGGVLREKPEDWDNVIETQLNSVFLLSKLAAASMVRQKSGKIINIGSMYSFFGSGLVPSYSAAKGAIIQLTKSMAIELAPHNWNLIVRWITPIIYQPIPVQPPTPTVQTTGVYGLGDMNPSFFLVPKKSKIIWGIGPTFVLPTATNTTYLGQGKLSMGPSVVVLVQPTHWTIGFLANNNVWSVAGHSNIDKPTVNQFLFQWFVNYNMKKGWYLTTSPIITANWRATGDNAWTVPFGGGVGRIMKLGFQPVNITAQFYGNAVHPAGTSPWGVRLQFVLLFPKLTKEQEKMLLEKKLQQMNQDQSQKQ